MAENFENLLDLSISTEDTRHSVKASEQIQIGRDVPQVRRQFKALLQTFVAQLELPETRFEPRDESSGRNS